MGDVDPSKIDLGLLCGKRSVIAFPADPKPNIVVPVPVACNQRRGALVAISRVVGAVAVARGRVRGRLAQPEARGCRHCSRGGGGGCVERGHPPRCCRCRGGRRGRHCTFSVRGGRGLILGHPGQRLGDVGVLLAVLCHYVPDLDLWVVCLNRCHPIGNKALNLREPEPLCRILFPAFQHKLVNVRRAARVWQAVPVFHCTRDFVWLQRLVRVLRVRQHLPHGDPERPDVGRLVEVFVARREDFDRRPFNRDPFRPEHQK